nr:MAG TPA: hypothetical protein [Caudoviricetes sp.]
MFTISTRSESKSFTFAGVIHPKNPYISRGLNQVNE